MNTFGISEKEFEVIQQNRELILNNLNTDPLQLALKGVNSSLCTQIRYLSKCRSKIPDYYHVAAIIPPLSYEQSSSALSVISRGYSGNRCLDLTCGLGVDSYYFSKSFKSVITIERDSLLSEIAKYNFSLLGCENIEIINCDSEQYVNDYSGEKFDMVFIDPARRNNDDKVFSFEQSSPNVIEILPILLKIAKRVVIKSSPMFDNNEAFEVFGDKVSLKTVSVGGECKELIIDICDGNKKQDIVSVISNNEQCRQYAFDNFPPTLSPDEKCDKSRFNYLLIVDVGFVKSRRVADLSKMLILNGGDTACNNYIILSEKAVVDASVRCFEIMEVFEYKPKVILNYIKEKKIKSATIIIKHFPYDISSIRKSLKLRDGSQSLIVATKFGGIDNIFFCK